MAEHDQVKEGKEDYVMTRIAYAFNVRQETALQKFKKSFETEENKYIGYVYLLGKCLTD